jgi:hypothetical protein
MHRITPIIPVYPGQNPIPNALTGYHKCSNTKPCSVCIPTIPIIPAKNAQSGWVGVGAIFFCAAETVNLVQTIHAFGKKTKVVLNKVDGSFLSFLQAGPFERMNALGCELK